MPDTGHDKQCLRRELRERRRRIAPAVRDDAGRQLAGQLSAIPGWDDVHRVAGYVAADAEIDPATLLDELHLAGKHLYLPVIQPDNTLSFAAWAPGDPTAPNRYGIPEPLGTHTLYSAGDLDAVLLPLVGWDRQGRRLGMGGGFYDRSLAGCEGVLKVGLAYAAQEIPELPGESWDVNLDFVATESALHACRATGGTRLIRE